MLGMNLGIDDYFTRLKQDLDRVNTSEVGHLADLVYGASVFPAGRDLCDRDAGHEAHLRRGERVDHMAVAELSVEASAPAVRLARTVDRTAVMSAGRDLRCSHAARQLHLYGREAIEDRIVAEAAIESSAPAPHLAAVQHGASVTCEDVAARCNLFDAAQAAHGDRGRAISNGVIAESAARALTPALNGAVTRHRTRMLIAHGQLEHTADVRVRRRPALDIRAVAELAIAVRAPTLDLAARCH